MYVQPNIRTFQARVDPLPKGVVPFESSQTMSAIEEAMSLTNAQTATPATLARGKIYYSYYCIFCHGDAGRGDGPVGESYVPAPSDLTSASIQSLSDASLLKAMLTGVGHEPVLERVVPSEHRWPIVLYIRSLTNGGTAVQPAL